MAGIFDGVFRPPRQRLFATPQAAPGPGWMQMTPQGGGSAGGAPDASARALQQYGPNGLLGLQMIMGMAGPGGGLNILDPKLAHKFFTPTTIGGLAPRYQAAFAKQTGKKA